MPDHTFEDIAKEDFSLRIIDLTASSWKEDIYATLRPPFAPKSPGYKSLDNLLLLAKNDLGALSAVIEPYVSTDWQEEYSTTYSRIFVNVPKCAQRVHFFSNRVNYQDLYVVSKELASAYLGYTVIRPLKTFRVGDTVLASPCILMNTGHHLVHCLQEFRVSLMGSCLRVEAMPFFQQETTVGVCAEADLWMVARYLHKKGEIRRYRPAEITALGTRTLAMGPPREGLYDFQIMDALRGMNLNPVLYYPKSFEDTKEFIYTCVESEIPVIASIPKHVLVIIGHDYANHVPTDIKSLSEVVESFIAHDDASGPYRKIVTGKIGKIIAGKIRKILTGKMPLGELLTLDGKRVESCIVALPPRVHLNRDDVRLHILIWLERKRIIDHVSTVLEKNPMELWHPDELQNLVLRTYLRLSRDFKCDITNERAEYLRSEVVISKYKCMQMPKYVWVVELAERSGLTNGPLCDRRICGEILFDSTANRHDPREALMAFHLNGMLFIQGRNGKKSELLVDQQELPYSPLRRGKPKLSN